ncbi:TetR family transcriptional regulator [Kribbella amoyensis]|uniref:TetR family transcriptional regulator n=1 Tax=Kribbella amoyensis TaxID=996641 RepID=A0A561BQ71_9ACTN|nr:helix-turn-helix domain-containing protein [Kribbella amoyensis]TWD81035.1 TetR family transcriptional regulator [Kribbella amoyensis]
MPDVKHFDSAEALTAVELLFWRKGAASTGIQDIVTATGLSRSSLYNAFGGKDGLYLTALQRYLDERSRPMFARLGADQRGLPAVTAFFDRLIRLRCGGDFARWGCFVTNAHADGPSEAAQAVIDQHHDSLHAAFLAALEVAEGKNQLRPGTGLAGSAEMLTLLAYAINLRSRAGTPRETLRAGATAAVDSLGR